MLATGESPWNSVWFRGAKSKIQTTGSRPWLNLYRRYAAKKSERPPLIYAPERIVENRNRRVARQQDQSILDDVRGRDRQCVHRTGRHDFTRR